MQLKSGKKNNIILVCIVFFLKTDAFTIPTVKNSVFLQEQLKAMVDAVDGILTEYIRAEMSCSSVEACRTLITSLQLTNLPRFLSLQGIPANWNEVLQNNTAGLQDFNYYLQSIFFGKTVLKEGSGSFNFVGSRFTKISAIVEDELKDVTNLLHQFIISLETDLQKTYCIDIDIKSLEEYPTCLECSQLTLPSPKIEVTRNYQFLLQFYSFLEDFKKLYNTFLTIYPIPDMC